MSQPRSIQHAKMGAISARDTCSTLAAASARDTCKPDAGTEIGRGTGGVVKQKGLFVGDWPSSLLQTHISPLQTRNPLLCFMLAVCSSCCALRFYFTTKHYHCMTIKWCFGGGATRCHPPNTARVSSSRCRTRDPDTESHDSVTGRD